MTEFKTPDFRKGLMLIISGPAGSGKTTLCDRLMEEFDSLQRIVTATTRAPRAGEQDGIDYHFFSNKAFEAKIEENAFYEHAKVHGRHYGTLKSEVKKHLDSGNDVILNIDVQGAASFRESAKSDPYLAQRLVTVFIQPDSLETIRARLKGRNSDDDAEIQNRIESALEEMKTAGENDYILPTKSRDHDYRLISSIYLAERHRVNYR